MDLLEPSALMLCGDVDILEIDSPKDGVSRRGECCPKFDEILLRGDSLTTNKK
jgi:hypothetical protein